MPDFNEPHDSKPILLRTRRRLRLPFLIAAVLSCVLFACGGCCLLVIFVLGPKVLEGPNGADEAASRVTKWALPAGFSGTSGAIMDNVLVQFDFAKFRQQHGRGMLAIGQMHLKVLPAASQRSQIQDLVEKSAPELKKIDFDDQTTRTMTIRGFPAEFQIGHGEDRASTTKYTQVIGYFRGAVDDAILILQFEDTVLTPEQLDDFLKSIN